MLRYQVHHVARRGRTLTLQLSNGIKLSSLTGLRPLTTLKVLIENLPIARIALLQALLISYLLELLQLVDLELDLLI